MILRMALGLIAIASFSVAADPAESPHIKSVLAMTWAEPVRAALRANRCKAILSVAVQDYAETNKDIEQRLNKRFRTAFRFKDRLGLRLGEGLGVFKPIKVIERTTLLDEGALPTVGRLDQAIAIRKSREAGIQELRLALDKAEERAWIFIPSIETWFYDTGRSASSNSVANNGILGPLLLAEYGDVELYHTHPSIASETQFDEHRDLFERNNLTKAASMPMLAIPSFMDMDALYGFDHAFDNHKVDGRPLELVSGHVVSQYGVTTYQIKAFYYTHQNGTPTLLIPSLGVSNESDVPLLASNLSTNQIIQEILLRAGRRSMQSMDFMREVHQWSAIDAPRFIFNFRPF